VKQHIHLLQVKLLEFLNLKIQTHHELQSHLPSEEVAKRAKELYNNGISQQVDIEENIGKMIIIDIEIGEYAIDKTSIESAHYLRNKNPLARLSGLHIGDKVAVYFCGNMEKHY
jgi:hypothetical protein